MGGACSMQELCTELWSESLKGRDLLQGLCVVGRIILKWVLKKCCIEHVWIHLAWDRVQWQAVVNMVRKLGFHKRQS
jgi:hypothetical protein